MDINVDGKPIKAIGVPSKQGWLYTFDRMTGQPVWPIVERPVEKGNVPGEWYSPTQPLSDEAGAIRKTRRFEADLDRLDTGDQRGGPPHCGLHKIGPIFTPPISAETAARRAC